MTFNLCLLRKFYPSILLLFLIYVKAPSSTAFRIIIDANFNNSSENFKYNSKKDEDETILDDTFLNYIVSNRFCDDRCKEVYEMAGYPYKKIMDVIGNTKKSVFQIGPIDRTHLIPRLPTPMDSHGFFKPIASACKKIYRRLYPIKGKGVDGKLYYIINVKGFQQITVITTCHKNSESCDNKDVAPENYTHTCKQIYEDVELSAFPVGSNITADAQIAQTFRIPTDCSCKPVQV